MTISDAMLRAIREDAAFTAARVGAPGSLMRQRAEATSDLCDEVVDLRRRLADAEAAACPWRDAPVSGRTTVLNELEHQRQCSERPDYDEDARAYAAAIAYLRAALPTADPAVRDVFWREFQQKTEGGR